VVPFKLEAAAAEEAAMIADTASRLASATVTRQRVRTVPAALVLGAMIAAAFGLRVLAALFHGTPRLFPDEYIYAELSRNIAYGSLTIRGHAASFPALLEPLLAAPLWAAGGIEVGYRLVQAMHALAATLTAVPVYLLARRLSVSQARSLACAAIALASPALVFSAYVTADAVGLPLAVGAITAGTFALERPSARAQLLFVCLAALATFGRVQYVILFPAFAAAALVLSRGSLRTYVGRYRISLALIVLPALAVLATGPARVLGYYGGVLDFGLEPRTVVYWTGIDGMMLVYAGGVVLLPAALVGMVASVVRPRTRIEAAAGTMTAFVAFLLLVEAVLYAANGSVRFQERYLIAILPLVPVFFCVAARRLDSKAMRALVAGAAAGAFVLAAIVPLSGFIVGGGKQDSPTLHAVYELERAIGVGNSALTVSLAAAGLALVGALAALSPRRGTPLALAAAFLVYAVVAAGAVAYDRDIGGRVERTFVAGGDPRWVDNARLGPVSILQTPWSDRQQISNQLFWNRSLKRILRMPTDTAEVDAFGSVPAVVRNDGRLVAAGRAVREPLLVQEYASWALLDGAQLVRRTVSTSLWRPTGTPRLKLLLAGRYLDGWLGAQNRLTVWPRPGGPRTGALTLTFSLPSNAPASTLDLTAPGVSRAVAVSPGSSRTVRIDVKATRRPWTLVIRSRAPFSLSDGRFVVAQISAPVFVDAAAKTS
jgi:hypothetical protein